MARKSKTRTEDAFEGTYASNVIDNKFAASAVMQAVAEIGAQLNLSPWEATVALRDFAQYLLAVQLDEKDERLQRELDELKARLGESNAKSVSCGQSVS